MQVWTNHSLSFQNRVDTTLTSPGFFWFLLIFLGNFYATIIVGFSKVRTWIVRVGGNHVLTT